MLPKKIKCIFCILKAVYNSRGVLQTDYSEVANILSIHQQTCHIPRSGPQPFKIRNLIWTAHQEFMGLTQLDTHLSHS